MRRLALLALLLIGVNAEAKTLFIDDYIARLERLHTSIATNELATAKTEAAELTGSEIVSPHGNFHSDDSLLSAIAEARKGDRVVLTRIELTIAELRNASAADAKSDPKQLQQVAAEQDVPELTRGGELTAPALAKLPLMERVFQSIGESLRWVGKKIRQFIDWMREFLPHSHAETAGATTGMRWIVIVEPFWIAAHVIFVRKSGAVESGDDLRSWFEELRRTA